MWQRTRWRRFVWFLGRYRPLILLAFGAGLVVAVPALIPWTSSPKSTLYLGYGLVGLRIAAPPGTALKPALWGWRIFPGVRLTMRSGLTVTTMAWRASRGMAVGDSLIAGINHSRRGAHAPSSDPPATA